MYPDEPRRVEEPRGGSVDKLELHLEALPSRPHATLWPYRPARRRDELLSSWLWRIAQGIAAPPKRFALDAIGAKLIDVDRDIDDETLERFAFLSGRSWNDMLNATLRHDIRANAFEDYEFARKAVLRYGDLVLQRHRGRNITPILQYCPVCLAHEDTAYLRRGWRFAFEVVCWQDGCLLLDSCWRCGATVNPLGQATPSTEFRCVKCNACLAEAPSLRMDELMALQDCIYSRIQRLAFGGVADLINPAVRGYLAFLAEYGLRGTNPYEIRPIAWHMSSTSGGDRSMIVGRGIR